MEIAKWWTDGGSSFPIALRLLQVGVLRRRTGRVEAVLGSLNWPVLKCPRLAGLRRPPRFKKLLRGGVQQVRVVLRALALLQLAKGASPP
jgi:hypothetical protein